MSEEKKVQEERYNAVEIATQTAPSITEDGKPILLEQALAKILNNQEKILQLIK